MKGTHYCCITVLLLNCHCCCSYCYYYFYFYFCDNWYYYIHYYYYVLNWSGRICNAGSVPRTPCAVHKMLMVDCIAPVAV